MAGLKIAFFLTQSLESPSGLGRFGPMARELAHRGHQVEIYALHPDFDPLQQPTSSPGEPTTVYVAPMHVKKSASTKTYYSGWKLLPVALQATIRLSQSALRTPADILHICKPHPMNSLAGLVGHAFRDKTIYLDCDDYEAGLGHFTSRWQKPVISAFEKQMPKLVTAVTTNTHTMQQNLISWGVPPDNITYIPNGVELSRFAPPNLETLQHIRTQLGLAGKQVISYIGTVGYASHPVYLLVEAFAQVIAKQPDAVLLIVGGGEDIDSLKALATRLGIDHAVHFTGRIPPDEVATYYYLSDISVDPVNDDDAARGRSPLKLFECWACGVPFITADVGDRLALIGSPPAGLLTTPGDASSLARTIMQLIDNPSLAAEIRQTGMERVKQFTWESLTGQLEQLYLEHRPI